MKHLLLALLFLISTAAIPQVPPPNILGVMLPYDEVRELMRQAVGFSRYNMPKVLPVVDLVPDAVWVATACPGKTSLTCLILGYYDDSDDTVARVIHVRNVPKGYGRPYQGIAVHEMVHYLQHQAGWVYNPDSCVDVAAHEMEAYEVEYVNDLAHDRIRKFSMSDILGECLSDN